MNRLVLIGNGFDLAHGLKTSYEDFIYWYFSIFIKKLPIYRMTLCVNYQNYKMVLGLNLFFTI